MAMTVAPRWCARTTTMSSFIDKAKVKAQQLAAQAKVKVDDYKDTKKADDLLDDLGRILYRQRTGRAEDGDDAAIADLVAQLQALEAEGVAVLHAKEPEQSDLPPPSAGSGTLPPPPPPAAAPATPAPATPLPDTPLPETPEPS